jgi:hypothetical protein
VVEVGRTLGHTYTLTDHDEGVAVSVGLLVVGVVVGDEVVGVGVRLAVVGVGVGVV